MKQTVKRVMHELKCNYYKKLEIISNIYVGILQKTKARL